MENYEIPDYENRKAALIEEIIAAFDGVSREGGISWSEAEVIDDYGDAGERWLARLSDKDACWQEIAVEQLAGNWPVSFLDPIGFRYYMPAFLLYTLHEADMELENCDDDELFEYNHDSLWYHLAAGRWKGEIKQHFLAKFEMFTPAQSRAIAHFLQLRAERNDAWERESAQLDAERNVDEEFELWKENNARKETEKLARMSPEQLKELEERGHEHEEYCAQFDWPNNDARYALEKYWGRFL